MNTRCKFKCDSVTTLADGAHSVLLSPVVGGSPENDKFWKWTPAGKLELLYLSDAKFVPGQQYYLDISLAAP